MVISKAFSPGSSKSKDISIATCGSTMHVSWIIEKIGSSPQEFDSSFSHHFLYQGDDLVKVLIRFVERSPFRGNIPIVKAKYSIPNFALSSKPA